MTPKPRILVTDDTGLAIAHDPRPGPRPPAKNLGRTAIAALWMAVLPGQNAFAQQGKSADEVGELKKKVAAQESVIQELLQWKKTVEASSTASAEARGDEPGSGANERAHFPQLEFHGFADVEYRASDRPGQKNAFGLGQLALFVTSRLAEDVSVLNENVIEANNKNEFGFEIERLLLQYTPSDYFNVAVGRSHTAIGWYNNAYHHGTWFQTATGRPFVFNFEDNEGIIATHNVGVSFSGLIPSGRLGLHYLAEVGNGRDYSTGREAVQTVVDNNGHKAVNLALFARPTRWPGLQAGVSVYHDRLTTDTLPDITQTIFAAHAIYYTPAFEWLNEGMLFRHAPSGTGQVHYTPAFYTQIARQFGPFRPFVRYQYFNAPATDPLFAHLGLSGLRHGPSVGLRYDFTELATLKLQYDHYFEPGNLRVNQFTAQVGFTF